MRHSKIFQFLVLLILLTCGRIAIAQTHINLGFRGGINFSSASITNLPDEYEISFQSVFGFGWVAEMSLFDFIYLQTEPRYIQKGPKLLFPFFGDKGIVTLNISYFEIPISVKAKFDLGDFEPYVFAGPALSFLLSAQQETKFQGQKVTESIKNKIKLTEFSLDFGVGIAYELNPKVSLTGDVRYTLGLSKVNKPKNSNDTSLWRSRDIKVFIGVLFPLLLQSYDTSANN